MRSVTYKGIDGSTIAPDLSINTLSVNTQLSNSGLSVLNELALQPSTISIETINNPCIQSGFVDATSSIQSQFDGVNSTISTIQSTLTDHESRISVNETNIATLSANQTTDETRITTLETSVATLTTNQTTDEATIADHGSRLTTAETSITSLTSTVDTINNSMVNLSGNQTISGLKEFTSIPIHNGYNMATIYDIQAAVTQIINGAPATLDTLKEISDQLAADEGALDSLLTVVGQKAVDNTVVHLSGQEDITGKKGFTRI